jgi:hypothetical protein
MNKKFVFSPRETYQLTIGREKTSINLKITNKIVKTGMVLQIMGIKQRRRMTLGRQ